MNWEMHVCDVCRLLDQDNRQKLSMYCKFCDSWMCQADFGNWGRRAAAALKKKMGFR